MSAKRDPKTHQTTIRFAPSQWKALEQAAYMRDMSVAQYVRDAARLRLEADADLLSSERSQAFAKGAEHAREHSLAEAESSVALWEQGRRAREQAHKLREESRRQRAGSDSGPVRAVPEPTGAASVWEEGGAARERAQMLHEQAQKSAAEKPAQR